MGTSKEKRDALINLQRYEPMIKFQESIVAFMIKEFGDAEEIDALQNLFKDLDKSHKQAIDRNDLLQGYLKMYDQKTAEQCVEIIFSKLDSDGSGTIEMEEWLIATINKENLLSPENIEKCFKIIDQDGGNTISIDEIKN